MDNNNNTRKKLSTKDFVLICVGIVLLALIIVAATGETYFGSFLTYILAFVFGAFYPAFLAICGVLSLYLIIRHSRFQIGGSVLGTIGFWVMMLSIIALCSYGYSSTTFSQFSTDYTNTFSNYASSFISIDNPSYLTNLGGGWLGGFLFTLFSSFMSKAGAVSLFVILLILGLGMLCAMPIYHFVIYVKKKNAEKVVYTSPYQKTKKNKKNSSEYQNVYAENPNNASASVSEDENYANIRDNDTVKPVRKKESAYESKLTPSSSTAKRASSKTSSVQETKTESEPVSEETVSVIQPVSQSSLRASNANAARQSNMPRSVPVYIAGAEQEDEYEEPEPAPVYEEEEEEPEPYVEPEPEPVYEEEEEEYIPEPEPEPEPVPVKPRRSSDDNTRAKRSKA